MCILVKRRKIDEFFAQYYLLYSSKFSVMLFVNSTLRLNIELDPKSLVLG